MPANITVPFTILHEGREEHVDQQSVTAQIKFKVAWNDRLAFMQQVAGTAYSTGVGGASITRLVPLAYPSLNRVYATSIDVEPYGISYCTNDPSYDWAIITVGFSTLPYDVENQQGSYDTVYRSISLSLSATTMTLPTSPFKFATGTNVRPNSGPGILIPTAEISITSHMVPYLPLEEIIPLVGGLNNASFYGCSMGTLMFSGCEANRDATSQGLQAYTVTYKFQFRPVDWNKFYSPTPGVGWDFLVDSSSGGNVYSYVDLSTLP